jgi:hypothetical protein
MQLQIRFYQSHGASSYPTVLDSIERVVGDDTAAHETTEVLGDATSAMETCGPM